MNLSDDYKDFINDKLLSYIPANRRIIGSDINFRCPFCGDSKKFETKKRGHYSTRKGVYHCFNCDVSMSGMKLLEYLSGGEESFAEIKQEFIRAKFNKYKSEFGRISNKNTTTATDKNSVLSNIQELLLPNKSGKYVISRLTNDAMTYLKNRGITDSTFYSDDLFLSLSVKNNPEIEYILIPWIINGIQSYYQINDFKKIDKFNRKYIFPANAQKTIFGLDNIDLRWNKIVVFEGVYDSLFVKNGISCGGKVLTEYQRKIIQERYPRHEIIIAFDNDSAGRNSSEDIISKFPNQKFFVWYDKTTKEKDINDYILADKNRLEKFSNINQLEQMIVNSVEMKMILRNYNSNGKINKNYKYKLDSSNKLSNKLLSKRDVSE